MGLSGKEVRVLLGSTGQVGVRLVNGGEKEEERHPRQGGQEVGRLWNRGAHLRKRKLC